MEINNKFRGTESLTTFLEWWQQRIQPGIKRPPLPDFFEVWNARQPTIDELRNEIEKLQSRIAQLEAEK